MAVAPENAEAPEQHSWSSGIAPAYIGTFLWVAFFDGLGRRSLPVGGLIPALGGAVAAAILAYLLLYRVAAVRAFTARRPLDDLAGSTFGSVGARLVPNLLIGLGQVALFAVGIGFATDFMLGGLATWGLFDPRVLRPVAWGRSTVPAPVFLVAALAWGTVTALVGMKIVRWIAAIMQYFPVFPALGLALTMAATFAGLPSFRPSGIDPATGQAVAADLGARLAFLAAFQWTFAFATLPGLVGADWGAASPTLADVQRGGWVGIAGAPAVVASLALLAVAGNEGKVRERAEATAAAAAEAPRAPRARPTAPLGAPAAAEVEPPAAPRYTFRAAVEANMHRRAAAIVLIIFGLASLAPACYAAHESGRRLARVVPGFSRVGCTLVGIAAGWFLVVGGWAERTDVVFPALGGVFAPVAGAMVAEATRRGAAAGWAGPRGRVNAAGLLAWGVGAAIGLAPVVARGVGSAPLARVPVAALLAFLAAFAAYRAAALLGLEPRPVPPAPGSAAAG